MLFKKTRWVELLFCTDADGRLVRGVGPDGVAHQRHRYTRPDCDVQLEWLSRFADITERQKGHQRLQIEKQELQEMRADVARYLTQIDGVGQTMTAEEIGEACGPGEVFTVWTELLHLCQLQEDDRGKSAPRSTSPSTTADASTAGPVPIRPNGHVAAHTP